MVDVYGLIDTPQGTAPELFRKDVLIGRNIEDGRVTGRDSESLPDSRVKYDFLSADATTLQSRVLIPRLLGSAEFVQLFNEIDDDIGLVTPMVFGGGSASRPYTVVPRNAALRLSFTGPVGVSDDFFVVRDSSGLITGLRNTEAVQLLQIAGDPTVAGNFIPLPTRVIVGERSLTLDPVLLGNEGLQYETRNNASGLPASPDNLGANIRIAIALDGPLAIPSLRESNFVGLNNAGRNAIVRDFRSGNDADDGGADLARGFVRDTEPPRILGDLPMFLERVDPVNALATQVTVWKGGISHDIDRGDVVRFLAGSTGNAVLAAEVVVDPVDDRDQPSVQHVRVRVRNGRDTAAQLEALDPSNRPDYPSDPAQLDAWLRLNAQRAVLVAEYQGGQFLPDGTVTRQPDDGRYFGLFTPTPLPLNDGSPSQPNENISPFANVVVRFTKPVDMRTVKSADTFYFATRNLTDQNAIDEFMQTRAWRVQFGAAAGSPLPQGVGMDPSTFNRAKFRTPHLIASRVLDEDQSQTTLRLQPLRGFYLDQAMRQDGPRPYYLHVIAGQDGIRDLAGNTIDLQTNDANQGRGLVIPFTLDTRSDGVRPLYEDNLAVYCVRAFDSVDEDENPSYYLPDEVQGPGAQRNAGAATLRDMFGQFSIVGGKLVARPTSRVRKVADDQNQAPVDPQDSILRWCPALLADEAQVISNSTIAAIGAGVQNPLNPQGSRLQTVWREVDLSLLRSDPSDFNLDIEQMYWPPFTGSDIVFDEFDRVTLILGHSERRPEPCVGSFSSLPTLTESGLVSCFDRNYVRNLRATGTEVVESTPAKHFAFQGTVSNWRIDPATAFLEVTGTNRYLPMPTFKKPYFVFRDETIVEQGCKVGAGTDVPPTVSPVFIPWILSPYSMGMGRRQVQGDAPPPVPAPNPPTPVNFDINTPINGFWNSSDNFNIRNTTAIDSFTDGLVGNVALPLLGDFLTECDSPSLPSGNGYVAQGINGWQCSITVQSSPQPNFRVYSAGRPVFPGLTPICREPSATTCAAGGYAPPPPFGVGGTTPFGDNTFYWVMIDFLKRQSVLTNGFIDLFNPHRVPNGFGDSRLGPYYTSASGANTMPANVLPQFSYDFEPPLTELAPGTSLVAQFRGASAVDSTPWYWDEWTSITGQPPRILHDIRFRDQLKPTSQNFPLDPFKAGDAHIRKFDDRLVNNVARNWWTYLYNRTVTTYVTDPNQLMNPTYLLQFAGPNEGFTPRDVRYINWRLLMSNNTDANPPVSPTLETFMFGYRFERTQR